MNCLQKCNYKNEDINFRNVSWHEGILTTKSDEALKGIPEEGFQKCFEVRNTMEKGIRANSKGTIC
jgi:hypothetical protein